MDAVFRSNIDQADGHHSNQILKPIWLYGNQLSGCANKRNIESIYSFQYKVFGNDEVSYGRGRQPRIANRMWLFPSKVAALQFHTQKLIIFYQNPYKSCNRSTAVPRLSLSHLQSRLLRTTLIVTCQSVNCPLVARLTLHHKCVNFIACGF